MSEPRLDPRSEAAICALEDGATRDEQGELIACLVAGWLLERFVPEEADSACRVWQLLRVTHVLEYTQVRLKLANYTRRRPPGALRVAGRERAPRHATFRC